jgi:hypothetical protein
VKWFEDQLNAVKGRELKWVGFEEYVRVVRKNEV